jgi:hypothetical protein
MVGFAAGACGGRGFRWRGRPLRDWGKRQTMGRAAGCAVDAAVRGVRPLRGGTQGVRVGAGAVYTAPLIVSRDR